MHPHPLEHLNQVLTGAHEGLAQEKQGIWLPEDLSRELDAAVEKFGDLAAAKEAEKERQRWREGLLSIWKEAKTQVLHQSDAVRSRSVVSQFVLALDRLTDGSRTDDPEDVFNIVSRRDVMAIWWPEVYLPIFTLDLQVTQIAYTAAIAVCSWVMCPWDVQVPRSDLGSIAGTLAKEYNKALLLTDLETIPESCRGVLNEEHTGATSSVPKPFQTDRNRRGSSRNARGTESWFPPIWDYNVSSSTVPYNDYRKPPTFDDSYATEFAQTVLCEWDKLCTPHEVGSRPIDQLVLTWARMRPVDFFSCVAVRVANGAQTPVRSCILSLLLFFFSSNSSSAYHSVSTQLIPSLLSTALTIDCEDCMSLLLKALTILIVSLPVLMAPADIVSCMIVLARGLKWPLDRAEDEEDIVFGGSRPFFYDLVLLAGVLFEMYPKSFLSFLSDARAFMQDFDKLSENAKQDAEDAEADTATPDGMVILGRHLLFGPEAPISSEFVRLHSYELIQGFRVSPFIIEPGNYIRELHDAARWHDTSPVSIIRNVLNSWRPDVPVSGAPEPPTVKKEGYMPAYSKRGPVLPKDPGIAKNAVSKKPPSVLLGSRATSSEYKSTAAQSLVAQTSILGQLQSSASDHSNGSVSHGVASSLRRSQQLNEKLTSRVVLLEAELNLAMWLHHNQTAHAGAVYRNKIYDLSVEAERQGLYRTVRTLRSQLKTFKSTLDQVIHESHATKRHYQSHIEEITWKLRQLRLMRTTWQDQTSSLKSNVAELESIVEHLRIEMRKLNSKIFDLETQLSENQAKVTKADEQQLRIDQLSRLLLTSNNHLALASNAAFYMPQGGSEFQLELQLDAFRHQARTLHATLNERESLIEDLRSEIRRLESRPAPQVDNNLPSTRSAVYDEMAREIENLREQVASLADS